MEPSTSDPAEAPFLVSPQHDAPEIAIDPISNQCTEYRLVVVLEPGDLLCSYPRHWVPTVTRQSIKANQRYRSHNPFLFDIKRI